MSNTDFEKTLPKKNRTCRARKPIRESDVSRCSRLPVFPCSYSKK